MKSVPVCFVKTSGGYFAWLMFYLEVCGCICISNILGKKNQTVKSNKTTKTIKTSKQSPKPESAAC